MSEREERTDEFEQSITRRYRSRIWSRFVKALKEYDLINWDDVINWVAREDGYGCLAAYDGEELELQDDLYAYRIN